MSLEKGKMYKNFILEEIKPIDEIQSVGYLFTHVKSGARLFYISNEDDNRVFSVTFKTVPKDNTGAAHIIEHSVLCGSDKYPLKEPFVELIKSSLNTFLNAITWPDKTMYPVASTNPKDFLNLIDVYLDGIFNPLILKSKLSFLQEGWHYEIDPKTEDLSVGGVVYSEMKGAYSNPEELLLDAVLKSLYPDTSYKYDSGGNPDNITDLTYEEFIAFYKQYYHPQNSYFFFYGNGDIEEHLEFVDEKCLKYYDKSEKFVEPEIAQQKPFDAMVEKEVEFDLCGDTTNENIFSLNYSVGKSTDRELSLAIDILDDILFDSETSPLKKALIESSIGAEYQFNYESSLLYPCVSIVAKQVALSSKDKFLSVIKDTLNSLVQNGIDPNRIEAAINHYEFMLKEVDNYSYPKGILYTMNIMSSWLYKRAPWESLEYNTALKNIKKNCKNGYFENIIEKYFLNNTHSSFVTLKATNGYSLNKEKQLNEALKAKKDCFTKSEMDAILEDQKLLTKHQKSVESEEVKNLVPSLSPDEIEKKPKKYDLEKVHSNGYETFVHTDECNNIVYCDIYFPIDSFTNEELSLLTLLSKCLGWFRTKNHSTYELHLLISKYLGDIDFAFNIFTPDEGFGVMPYFTVSFKGLSDKAEDFFPLACEILTSSVIDDMEQLRYTLSEEFSQQKNKILTSAHAFACARLKSYFEPRCEMGEYISGVEYFNFLNDVLGNFDKKKEALCTSLRDVYRKVINLCGCKSLIVCDEKERQKVEKLSDSLCASLEKNEYLPIERSFIRNIKNEGFVIPSNVYYVAQGFNYRILGFESCGALLVLKKYLSTEYLWNNIRAMGGAYGAMASIDIFGNFSFVTYRDPHLRRTLDIYKGIPEEVRNFDVSDESVKRTIVGTISDIDTPLSAYSKGKSAFIDYMRGYKFDKKEMIRHQVLSTSKEDIQSLFSLAKECMDMNAVCVFGKKDKIENCDMLEMKKTLF